MAGAAAGFAGAFDNAPVAVTLRAGALDGEESLGGAHLAVAGAGRTLLGMSAGGCAGAAADFAGDSGGDFDLGAAAAIGLFQRDLKIVAKIAAAVLPAPSPAAAHDLAEQIVEHVGEGRGEIERMAAAMAVAVFEGRMAEMVVSRALLLVLQDVIGFVEFLEFAFGGVVALVAVGVQLHGELAVGRLDLGDRRPFLAAQNLVIVALHGASPRQKTENGIQGSDGRPHISQPTA